MDLLIRISFPEISEMAEASCSRIWTFSSVDFAFNNSFLISSNFEIFSVSSPSILKNQFSRTTKKYIYFLWSNKYSFFQQYFYGAQRNYIFPYFLFIFHPFFSMNGEWFWLVLSRRTFIWWLIFELFFRLKVEPSSMYSNSGQFLRAFLKRETEPIRSRIRHLHASKTTRWCG